MSDAVPCSACQRGDPCAENERLLRAEVARLQRDREEVVGALGKQAHPGLSPGENVAEVVAEVERLRAALVEIRSLPCDCDCPLDGGQHFHDCVTGSTAVDIARCALAGEEQTEHYVCPECGVTKATEYGECKFCGRDITIEPKEE